MMTAEGIVVDLEGVDQVDGIELLEPGQRGVPPPNGGRVAVRLPGRGPAPALDDDLLGAVEDAPGHLDAGGERRRVAPAGAALGAGDLRRGQRCGSVV